MEQVIELVADEPADRLDRFLAAKRNWSRAQVQRWIDGGRVSVDGRPGRVSQRVGAGSRIAVRVPPPALTDLEPEDIPISVVYQDADVLVIEKPAGLVVHPSPGHETGTLVHGILSLVPELQHEAGTVRPGIVHRLDKDTSGLMVVAKHERAMRELAHQMHRRTMLKEYLALANGIVRPAEGIVDGPIGRDPRNRQKMAVVSHGRAARTRYRTIEPLGRRYSYLLATLETGRTHQIRVHLASIGHVLIGDRTYGDRSSLSPRQFLHAHRLGFQLPSTGEWKVFESPLPPDLQAVLERARQIAEGR